MRGETCDYAVGKDPNALFRKTDRLFFLKSAKFYGEAYDPASFKTRMITVNKARTIALDFMKTHYIKPDLLSESDMFISTPDDGFSRDYMFRFSQRLENGIFGPSVCEVNVDTILGRVVRYEAKYYPVNVSLKPFLTPEQAVDVGADEIDMSPCNGGHLKKMRISSPDYLGLEQFIYEMYIQGKLSDSDKQSIYEVDVDANTACVLYTDDVTDYAAKITDFKYKKGANPFKDFAPSIPVYYKNKKTTLSLPPRLIDGYPYVAAGYLSKVKSVNEGTMDFRSGNSRGSLQCSIGSKDYILTGEKLQTEHPPAMVGKECYLPIEMINGLLPISYDKTKRQLTLDL